MVLCASHLGLGRFTRHTVVVVAYGRCPLFVHQKFLCVWQTSISLSQLGGVQPFSFYVVNIEVWLNLVNTPRQIARVHRNLGGFNTQVAPPVHELAYSSSLQGSMHL